MSASLPLSLLFPPLGEADHGARDVMAWQRPARSSRSSGSWPLARDERVSEQRRHGRPARRVGAQHGSDDPQPFERLVVAPGEGVERVGEGGVESCLAERGAQPSLEAPGGFELLAKQLLGWSALLDRYLIAT